VIAQKLWIQQDNTEEGVVDELIAAGISPEQIVLAFQSPEGQKHTEFAIS
jgi:tryptophanyl-tRNA synthetase